MIKGARHWNNRDLSMYVQTNNAAESFAPLEACGPTAAVMCIAALGERVDVHCPGPWRPQPEDVLHLWFLDPRNIATLRAIRDLSDVPGNRVPQYYPRAVAEVFAVRCDFVYTNKLGAIQARLDDGHTVQLCLEQPGHYIAVLAYDTDTGELIYNDPWPARVGGDGFNRRMGREEYERNVQPFALIYGGGK